MTKNRLLSFQLSQKLTEADLGDVSGAGHLTMISTSQPSHGGCWDTTTDISWDM